MTALQCPATRPPGPRPSRRGAAAASAGGARAGRIAGAVLLGACAAVTALPLLLLLINALKDNGQVIADPIGWPRPLHPGNLADAWNGKPAGVSLARNFANSVVVTLGTVAVVTVLATLTGYALGGYTFRGERYVTQAILIILAVPVQATLIPVFEMLDDAGLRNSYVGIILVYSAFWLPFSVLLVRAAVRAFPRQLLEAARVDGAGELTTLLRVVLPVVKGPIAGVAIVNAIGVWSELLFSYVLLTEPRMQTLPAAIIAYQGVFITDYRLLYAGLLISVAPVLVFYAVVSRAIRKGMSAGSFR